MRVYILLFNAGTDNEGIHSLNAKGRNTVLMFEEEDDAVRFGLMLEAQDFPTPTVEAIGDDEVMEFCEGAGFDCKLVPAGTLVTPPESVMEEMDWDPNEAPQDRPTAAPKTNAAAEDLSESELDDIRKRLEGLL
jgi:hypothetical protein